MDLAHEFVSDIATRAGIEACLFIPFGYMYYYSKRPNPRWDHKYTACELVDVGMVTSALGPNSGKYKGNYREFRICGYTLEAMTDSKLKKINTAMGKTINLVAVRLLAMGKIFHNQDEKTDYSHGLVQNQVKALLTAIAKSQKNEATLKCFTLDTDQGQTLGAKGFQALLGLVNVSRFTLEELQLPGIEFSKQESKDLRATLKRCGRLKVVEVGFWEEPRPPREILETIGYVEWVRRQTRDL